MIYRRLALGLAPILALASVAGTALAEASFPTAGKPEDVGLSSTQLKRLEAETQKHIDAGLVPGAVMMVARRGKVAWTSVLGDRDKAANAKMQMDSIFRIYSMTKPIVSVALMQMVEEGKLQISDPVAQYLPEIGKMKVGVEKVAADGTRTMDFVEPKRPMTVQDLLRHTSGLIYGGRGDSLVNKAYNDAKIGDRAKTNAELVTALSALPLRFSPGDQWEYGVSVDVQGRLLEVIDGKPLAEVLAERVLRPLGMNDTGFWIPAEKMNRAAQPWQRPNAPPMTPRFDVAERAKYQSGGGGMVSTLDDYLRFTMMLANGGELQGKRVLGKKTVEFMIADHLTNQPGRPPGLGFGLGFEVRRTTGDAGLPGSVGEYGWAGNAGTLFWIDPKEQLIAIYMVQASDPDRIALRNRFRAMVQAAIID